MKNVSQTSTRYNQAPSSERHRGFEDARAGRQYCADYDGWNQFQQINYERGRCLHAIVRRALGRELPRWDGIQLFSHYSIFNFGLNFHRSIKPDLVAYRSFFHSEIAA